MEGIGYKVAGHIWNANEVGNYTASSPDDLLYLYAEYMNDVKDLRDKKGLSAVVYTEITDVIQELVGLMTYDRVPKVDPAKIALANHFMLKMPSYIAVVPTSEQTGQDWRYTTTKPADNWTTAGYSDAQWLEGKGGFGAGTDHAGTSWTTSDIWMRRHFTPGSVSADQAANLVLRDLHMGAVEVFINGVRAYSQRGRSNSWEYRGISSEARTSIRANADNVLSVHCARAANSQFIDVGLSERIGAYQ